MLRANVHLLRIGKHYVLNQLRNRRFCQCCIIMHIDSFFPCTRCDGKIRFGVAYMARQISYIPFFIGADVFNRSVVIFYIARKYKTSLTVRAFSLASGTFSHYRLYQKRVRRGRNLIFGIKAHFIKRICRSRTDKRSVYPKLVYGISRHLHTKLYTCFHQPVSL